MAGNREEPKTPLKVAAVAPVAVTGVPSHELPASPYGARTRAPAFNVAPPPARYQPQDSQDNDEDYGGENDVEAMPIPPAPPRFAPPSVIQARRDQAYRPSDWPPNWGPQPYPRGVGPGPYYYYGR